MFRQNQFPSEELLQNKMNHWEYPSNGNQDGAEMMVKTSSNAEQNLSTKKRMSVSGRQRIVLEGEFAKNRYIGQVRRVEVAEEVNMTPQQVTVWFCNRRVKEKKILKENRKQNESVALSQPSTPSIIHPRYSTSSNHTDILTTRNELPSNTRIPLQTPAARVQPVQPQNTDARNQPQTSTTRYESELLSVGNRSATLDLPYLMGGMTVTQQSNYCGYWAHDFSCRCSKMNFSQPDTTPVTSYVDPMESICDGISQYVPCMDEYEYDFFTDYS